MSAITESAANSGAIAACLMARRVLDDTFTRLDVSRLAAVEDWVGPHRRAYDDAWAQIRGSADDAGAALVAVHALLVAADEEARASLLLRGAC